MGPDRSDCSDARRADSQIRPATWARHAAPALWACLLLCGGCSTGLGCQSGPRVLRSLRAGAQDAGIALEEFPGGTLGFSGSPLRLSLKSAELTDSKAHLHVLATTGASELDYCLMGLGPDRQSATNRPQASGQS